MGRGIRLTHEELNQVDLLRFKTTSADIFRNCLIIVMSHFGDTIAHIAERLGCGTETVVRIRREYRERGLEALKPQRSPGRPSRATLGFIEAMKEAVAAHPQELGYGFSTWSTKRLAAHLKKVTGISFGEDQLRRLLHRHGYSVQRPKHTMKGKRDEQAYQQAAGKLDRLKKKATRAQTPEVLIYQDEVEIHRHPTLCRVWAPIGSQPEVPAPGQNQKTVAYGGVNYATGRITYTMAPTKSGTNFLMFLKALLRAYPDRRIRLVCDNGRFHHTKAVALWLKAHADRINVFWLPPYSPSLNLIERLWGHLKRTVLANVLFKTIEDLIAAFRKGIARVNGRRDQMGFMFKHENSRRKTA